MSECRRIESLLPPYVDGETTPEQTRTLEAHLTACVVCRAQVEAERVARAVLRARRQQLRTAVPPGLRTRIAAAVHAERLPRLSWPARAAAFAAAAVVLIAVGTALEFVSPRSNVLFAAQLAIDHVRCFIVELGSMDARHADELQAMYAADYGWSVTVPPSDPERDLTLIAARRCPFWLGDHAHLLYRAEGHELSLYVTEGGRRPDEHLNVLGHSERIWSTSGSSYALVARGMPPDTFDRLAAYLQARTR
jgi:anti-sigma factor RsiW